LASSRFFAVRGPETVYGDGATGDTFKKIRVTGVGDPVNRNPAFEEAIDISVATYSVGGPYVVNGTIDALLRFGSFEPLFSSMFGSAESGKYYLGDVPESYAFCIGDDQAGTQTMYYGCGISSMEFTLAVREFVRTRMTWIGQKGIITSGVDPEWYVAPTADPAAVYYNAVIEIGGTPLEAKNVTLRCDRKFDTDYHYIGSPLLQGLYMNGQTELGGTITLGGGQWNTLKEVITGGETTMITTPPGTVAASGAESLNELGGDTLEIQLSDKDGNLVGTIVAGECVFSESNRSVTGRNQWDKSVNFRVIVPTSESFYIEPVA
jgi:hypothetical protein